jgi:hypothetical protein
VGRGRACRSGSGHDRLQSDRSGALFCAAAHADCTAQRDPRTDSDINTHAASIAHSVCLPNSCRDRYFNPAPHQYSEFDRHGHSHVFSHAGSQLYIHRNSDAYSYICPNANPHTQQDDYAGSDENAHTHPSRHRYISSIPDTDPHLSGYVHSCVYPRLTHADTHSLPHPDGDHHPHSDASVYSHLHTDTFADPDDHQNADRHAHTAVVESDPLFYRSESFAE